MKKALVLALMPVLFACNKSANVAPVINPSPVVPDVYTDILNFNGTNGSVPYGNITVSGIVLYGMTEAGGKNRAGNIFSVYNNGTEYKDLHDFSNSVTDGSGPTGSLTISGGILYGMTLSGGAYGAGIIFSYDPKSSGYKVLYNFGKSSINGINPYSSLIVSGNVLYGTTEMGGVDDDGTIFSIHTDGTQFTSLFSFNYTNGGRPVGSLILSGNTLYGMTEEGGMYYDGVIFSLYTDGSLFNLLYSFRSNTGYEPEGNLTLCGNTLFGLASGGQYNDGCIFSINLNGSNYRDLFDFDYTNGEWPYGSLTISGSTLYGMTESGGPGSNTGVIFSMDTSGSAFTNLHTFNSETGMNPQGSLILSNNILYGMTNGGGKYNKGVVFGYSL